MKKKVEKKQQRNDISLADTDKGMDMVISKEVNIWFWVKRSKNFQTRLLTPKLNYIF